MEIRSIGQFLDYWANFRGRTKRVAACIPEDRIEWTHQNGNFTLGDILRHLAALERWMFAENVSGRPSRYQGCGRELADGYDAVMEYFDRMDQEAVAIFRTLSDEALQQKCRTPGGVAITAWKWLRSMVEHEAHHRGQIYLMLGMLGVRTPPLYGLTHEEVRDRSLHSP
jgi:uncharacterized damage-inducible protein DinB